MVFGQRPMRWSDVEAYVRTLRALLRGEEAEWDGTRLKMLHTAHCIPPRPIDVPILIGADGPKGLTVAANVADGVFSAVVPQSDTGALTWRALLLFGTVLDDGEAPTSPRALGAVGPALAVGYHALYERRGASAVDRLPGGSRWRESVEAARSSARHLEIHEGHLIEPNRHDQLVIEDAAPLAPTLTMTGTAADVHERLVALAAAGVTEIAYQPAGPDIARELEAFAAAADGV
jgi:5,10-methylenetetrahydromethanopterin reductase